MSTANFDSDKHGIFMVEDYEGDYEGDYAMLDALDNITGYLKEHGCECTRDYDYTITVTESKTGLVMATLNGQDGYYSDSQIILRTGRDLYHDSIDEGYSYNFDKDCPLPMWEAGFSRKYAVVTKALKLFTQPLKVAGVFSNGEAVYIK